MSLMNKHTFLEKNSLALMIGVIVVVLIGGIVEIMPLFRKETVIEPVEGMRPYTPLELAGQNIYMRENCVVCHSQQIRALRDEVVRYGHYSLAAESMYDHPFLWGSKRTGPDLARVGGRYSDDWHRVHLTNPRDLVPESNMPGYPWLSEASLDPKLMENKIKGLMMLGDPYSEDVFETIEKDFADKSEMDALIIYLQHMGTNRTGRKRND